MKKASPMATATMGTHMQNTARRGVREAGNIAYRGTTTSRRDGGSFFIKGRALKEPRQRRESDKKIRFSSAFVGRGRKE